MIRLFKNPFTDFIAKAVLIYVVWEILYRNFIIYSPFSMFIVDQITYASAFLLDLFYQNVEVRGNGQLYVDGTYTVYVSPDCNALDFMGAFLSFLLAYPAKLKSKIGFGVIMLLVINLFNIIRVALLAVTALHYYKWFDFNHHYLFNIIIYAIIILSIIIWVKKYVDPAKDTAK